MNRTIGLIVRCGAMALCWVLSVPAQAQQKDAPKAKAPEMKQPAGDSKKYDYSVEGQFVEACSCRAPCACELTGDAMKGCQGVGALEISKGSYKGVDLAGVKMAYALGIGEWVDIYVDAKTPEQKDAAKALAKAAFVAFGPIQDVKDGKIELTKNGYSYAVAVDGGKTMSFQTEPVLGGDKKTPLVHDNVANPFMSSFKQGKSVACSYHGSGNKSFTVEKGRNVYFNDKMSGHGQI